jgi:predicted RNA binding protein YcfA (HicA-like mRNA interferase family)
MSPPLRQVTGRDLARVARRLGFLLHHQTGSHAVFKREVDQRRVVIPMHGNRALKPKTLRSILNDMGIEPEDYLRLS